MCLSCNFPLCGFDPQLISVFVYRQGSLGKIENGYREGDDLQEQAVGVEVSYNDDENQELHWI